MATALATMSMKSAFSSSIFGKSLSNAAWWFDILWTVVVVVVAALAVGLVS